MRCLLRGCPFPCLFLQAFFCRWQRKCAENIFNFIWHASRNCQNICLILPACAANIIYTEHHRISQSYTELDLQVQIDRSFCKICSLSFQNLIRCGTTCRMCWSNWSWATYWDMGDNMWRQMTRKLIQMRGYEGILKASKSHLFSAEIISQDLVGSGCLYFTTFRRCGWHVTNWIILEIFGIFWNILDHFESIIINMKNIEKHWKTMKNGKTWKNIIQAVPKSQRSNSGKMWENNFIRF